MLLFLCFQNDLFSERSVFRTMDGFISEKQLQDFVTKQVKPLVYDIGDLASLVFDYYRIKLLYDMNFVWHVKKFAYMINNNCLYNCFAIKEEPEKCDNEIGNPRRRFCEERFEDLPDAFKNDRSFFIENKILINHSDFLLVDRCWRDSNHGKRKREHYFRFDSYLDWRGLQDIDPMALTKLSVDCFKYVSKKLYVVFKGTYF